MRIFFFSQYYEPGADAASVTIGKLVSFLSQDTHDVSLFLPVDKTIRPQLSGITIYQTRSFPGPFTFYLTPVANFFRSLKVAKTSPPDLLIAEYLPHTLTAVGAVWAKFFLHRPLMLKAHDIVPVYPANPLKAAALLMSSNLNRLFARWADVVVVVSPELKDLATRVLHLSGERIAVQPNGTDVPTKWTPLPAAPWVLFIGGLYPEDGLEIALQAWPQVRQAVPGAQLRIVGDGPERQRFVSLVTELAIADSVTFVGRLPHADIPAEIRQARVCIGTLKTTYQLSTSVPNKTVEYLAEGRPIVSSQVSSIIPADTYLLALGVDQVAQALINLLTDQKQAEVLSKQAFAAAGKIFAWPQIRRQFAMMLKDLYAHQPHDPPTLA